MRKIRQWLIYVEDNDNKAYEIIGPVDADAQPDWIEAILAMEKSGRNISFQEVEPENEKEAHSYAKKKGFNLSAEGIVLRPRDSSKDFKGNVPEYAKTADMSRLVKVLCKSKCGKTRFCLINKPYPGEKELRSAAHGEYRATCLKCGGEALDNYNWYR